MSSENLAVVLLDSLLKPQNTGDEPTRSEALLAYIIDNYKIIFTRDYMDEINTKKEDFERLLKQTHIQDFAPVNNNKNDGNNNNNNNGDVCLEGYLSKKGEKGLVKLWKKRYFRLRNDMRLYYSEEKTTAPLGNIGNDYKIHIPYTTLSNTLLLMSELKFINFIFGSDLYSVSEVKSTGIAWGNERGLDIHTAGNIYTLISFYLTDITFPGRVYQLSAPSPDLLNYWVEGLQQFLQEIKANPMRDHPFMQVRAKIGLDPKTFDEISSYLQCNFRLPRPTSPCSN